MITEQFLYRKILNNNKKKNSSKYKLEICLQELISWISVISDLFLAVKNSRDIQSRVLNYVSYVPLCICFLHTFVYLCALLVFVFYVFYVPLYFTILHLYISLMCPHNFMCFRCLHFFVSYVPWLFWVPPIFKVPYVPSLFLEYVEQSWIQTFLLSNWSGLFFVYMF